MPKWLPKYKGVRGDAGTTWDKIANAKQLGSFFIRLGHSEKISEVTQKYAQLRQQYIPHTQFTIIIYSHARSK